MVRKVSLTPIQNRIMWLIEEAGEENLPCINATLRIEDEVAFDRDIEVLEQIGFVRRDFERHTGLPSLVLTDRGRDALTK